ncbi:protease family c26 gamma-glutamyl hydrolase [Anaeramoeba flamelloides]|uniref:folate gamma-glutamyl hydrolase n=1 Tax=Anaeramoeba flamelloides TaxID=1746091 RepID=A0ABQ8YJP9_9EUKA|nr:protease family c26 gamma-glutamyl hydrolase [Anaeramoeba flamelloides]
MQKLFYLVLLVLLPLIFCVNNRPVIGILTEPNSHALDPLKGQYIAASYVKWIESSGGRAYPIKYDSTETEILDILSHVNGVLFPGGGVDLNEDPFKATIETIYNEVIKKNKEGTYFPLWGTCLGFEILSVLASENPDLLSQVDAENLPLPLAKTQGWGDSRLMSGLTSELEQILTTENVTFNNHRYGVSTESFMNSPKLDSFMRMISWNKGRKGNKFVSSFEGYQYPIYGVQFHPEKNLFEWGDEDIPHYYNAILITQYFGNFLVNEARKNNQHFENESTNNTMYKICPTYTEEEGFEQSYIWQYN